MKKTVVCAVLCTLAIAGCSSTAVQVRPSEAVAEAPTANPVEPQPTPATTIILGATSVFTATADGTVLDSVAFTEPVSEVVELFQGVFASEPIVAEYPTAECSPFTSITWGDAVLIDDETSYSPQADPRSRLPYRIAFSASELDGIALTSTVGLTVGEVATDFFAAVLEEDKGPSGPVGGVMLAEQGGTYLRELPGTEPAYYPVGTYAVSDGGTGVVNYITAPAIGVDLYC